MGLKGGGVEMKKSARVLAMICYGWLAFVSGMVLCACVYLLVRFTFEVLASLS